MPKPNLVSALAKALARPTRGRPAASPVERTPTTTPDVLLAALRNSITTCDEIMQRRIGVEGKDS